MSVSLRYGRRPPNGSSPPSRGRTAPRSRSNCDRGDRRERDVLEVLPGGDPLDGAAAFGLLAAGDERPDVDDALALLAGDLRPVVGVGGVGQVLVLLELLADGVHQVLGTDALLPAGDQTLD